MGAGVGDRRDAFGVADIELVRAQVLAEGRAVAAVSEVIDESFSELVDTVMALRGKVITTAAGNSAAVAARLAHLLSLAGVPSLFLDANHALHGSIGAIQSSDLLLVVSKGGMTEEVNQCAELAKSTGATVVAVTQTVGTPLTYCADHIVRLPASDADPSGVVGLGSALAQAAWGDALVFALLLGQSVSADELAARHPRGLLGHLAAQGRLTTADRERIDPGGVLDEQ